MMIATIFRFSSGKINQQQGIYCSHSVQRIGKTRQTKPNICFMSAKNSHMRLHVKPKNSFQDYSFRSLEFIWASGYVEPKKHKKKTVSHTLIWACAHIHHIAYTHCEVCDSHLFLSFLSVNLKFD